MRSHGSLACYTASGPAPATRVGKPQLSGREREILDLLAEGCSNRKIARRLQLSEASVKGHVSSLLEKLGRILEARNTGPSL